ncbi:MAG TPA: hypothetical protein VFA06_12375 [Actinocrinis sp.]|uniref:hypothetical protein n=1 Tax=Actinocrinis sp. TaxID=1920516 RepID=UPI002D752780|nr:hypothetical protein [Actinocrinis sp.]HZU56659.1 hypothetical protein [Actinocrinis sp.]
MSTPSSSLTDAFAECGVDSRAALEQMLSGYQGGGWLSRFYMDASNDPGPQAWFARGLAYEVVSWGRAAQEYSPGIKHFTLLGSSKVDEAHLRKALFLASCSTFIFPEAVEFHVEDFTTDEGDQIEGWDFKVSADLIRHMYEYRRLIDASAVRFLGSTMSYQSTYNLTGAWASDYASGVPDIRALGTTNSGELPKLLSALRDNRQVLDLAQTRVPWIEKASLNEVLSLREENADLISTFQQAYHKALLEQVMHAESVDFERISRQIEGDVVGPSVRAIERRYAREVASHRRLRRLGASVAFLPIAGTIIGATIFHKSIPESLASAAAPTIAALTNALMVNRSQRKLTDDTLTDQPFYLVWKIMHDVA